MSDSTYSYFVNRYSSIALNSSSASMTGDMNKNSSSLQQFGVKVASRPALRLELRHSGLLLPNPQQLCLFVSNMACGNTHQR
ncbi:hypothetical protein [Nostoc sp.]|uniref:hypothetical protein n=1 Tax=Nostoc sp. TaxID=1180 RepID=UPI002FF52CBD